LPLVYDELRQLAAQKLAQEKPGQTLDATALVHEAYVRLVASPLRDQAEEPRFKDRFHFYNAAAEAMRRILIDNARKKKAEKRGGQRQAVAWHDNIDAPSRPTDDLLAVDDALTQLAAEDPESAQLVKMRFYTGLSVEDAGAAMGLSRASAYRTWTFAKAWLRTKLAEA
jgi:RNA polymerase sigma factor (TIGR02999 family)